jgi:hypothetical protein
MVSDVDSLQEKDINKVIITRRLQVAGCMVHGAMVTRMTIMQEIYGRNKHSINWLQGIVWWI